MSKPLKQILQLKKMREETLRITLKLTCFTKRGQSNRDTNIIFTNWPAREDAYSHWLARGDNWTNKHEKWHRSTLYVQLQPQSENLNG